MNPTPMTYIPDRHAHYVTIGSDLRAKILQAIKDKFKTQAAYLQNSKLKMNLSNLGAILRGKQRINPKDLKIIQKELGLDS